MPNVNYAAIGVAAVASFVASALWYGILGGTVARLQREWRGQAMPERLPGWQVVTFVVVAVLIAFVIAVLFAQAGISGLVESLGFGLLLWGPEAAAK